MIVRAATCGYFRRLEPLNTKRGWQKGLAMTGHVLEYGAILTLLFAPTAAFADDPTGVLEQEEWAKQPLTAQERAQLPAFSDGGPCQRGMQSEAFPNGQ
jgi:hypothetical protein